MAKRKSTQDLQSASLKKLKAKPSLSPPTTEPVNVKASFRDGLFDDEVLKEYNNQYNTSGPYALHPTPYARAPY